MPTNPQILKSSNPEISLCPQVFDDEDLFARPDQPELAAGDFLDRVRILFEPIDFLAHTRVLGALPPDRGCQFLRLTPRSDHRKQPLLAHQRVDDNHRGDEEQQHLNDAPGSIGTFLSCAFGILCHARAENTSSRSKVQAEHFLSEGLRPSDSPTRSLARRCAGALRSRGSLARLARLAGIPRIPRAGHSDYESSPALVAFSTHSK